MIFALLNPRKITFFLIWPPSQKLLSKFLGFWGFFVEKYWIYLVVCLPLVLFQHMEPSGYWGKSVGRPEKNKKIKKNSGLVQPRKSENYGQQS